MSAPSSPETVLKAAGPAADSDRDRILIIGAGIAGLTCGCYLQMQGYQTEIVEAGDMPGGLCVGWQRGAFVFDGCLRWLIGVDPASFFHRLWSELGALGERRILRHEEFLRFESPNGQALSMTRDLDRLARDMKRIGPEDGARIDKLIAAARRCAPLDPPDKPLELMNVFEKTRLLVRYLPILITVGRWKNRELGAYAATYKSRFLQEALLALGGDPRMSALVVMMVLAWRSTPNAGFVVGGSRAFNEAIVNRYQGLGGRLRCHAEVDEILVENGKACGVRCAGGEMLRAGTVVSCADGHATIFKMLRGKYLTSRVRRLYEKEDLFPGLLQISIGAGRTWPDTPHDLVLQLEQPLMVDDATRHHRIEVAISGAESGLCPPGTTIMLVRFFSRHEFWAELRERAPEEYKQRKDAILRQVISILDRRFPGLEQSILNTDVASPATFSRFTGNWRGSFQGWLPTPRILGRRIPRTLPGLDCFYMAGQWIEPGGGVPSVALSGFYVSRLICERDGKKFTTRRPTP
jgi:phytoene dehydrogenase-like protein